MPTYYPLTTQEWLIVVLFFTLIISLFTMRRLRRQLKEEIRKRTIPVLTPYFDMNDLGLYISNDGDCYVRDISVGDINVTVDAGFPKNLDLRFSSIDLLKPKESAQLTFQIFEKGSKMPVSVVDKLGAHLANAQFTTQLFCNNMENMPFSLMFTKEGDSFRLTELKSNKTNP